MYISRSKLRTKKNINVREAKDQNVCSLKVIAIVTLLRKFLQHGNV